MAEIMGLSFNALAPTFLFIAAGYLCKRAGAVNESDQPRMNAVGFRVFLPVMLFYQIYTAETPTTTGLRVLVFNLAALGLVYVSAVLFTLRFEKRAERRGVMIQAIFRSNYVLLGLPIVTALYPDAAGLASISIAVMVPVFNMLAVISLEMFNGKKINCRHMAADVLKNPLILSSLLGIVFMLTGLQLPDFMEQACHTFSQIATPYLLFLLGVFFRFHIRLDGALAVCLIGRLIAIPALVLAAAAALGFRGGEFVTVLAMFASPPATSSFTMAQQLGGDARLAGNTVVLGCVLSSVTIFLWMCLFMKLGIM